MTPDWDTTVDEVRHNRIVASLNERIEELKANNKIRVEAMTALTQAIIDAEAREAVLTEALKKLLANCGHLPCHCGFDTGTCSGCKAKTAAHAALAGKEASDEKAE